MGILTGIILAAAIAGLIILNLPAFGRLPRGSRLERILQSPNYRDGQFRNLEASPMMTGDKSRLIKCPLPLDDVHVRRNL